jgi:hypothetical protein
MNEDAMSSMTSPAGTIAAGREDFFSLAGSKPWESAEGQLARLAAALVAEGPASFSAGLDNQIERANAAVRNFAPLRAGLDFLDGNRGKLVRHLNAPTFDLARGRPALFTRLAASLFWFTPA